MSESVMNYNPEETSFQSSLQKEYTEAKQKGFNGTFEQFLLIRDYT